MDPITIGATIVGVLAALVAAWQNNQKSKAELTIDTLIAAIELAEQVDPEVIKKLKAQVQDLAERTGVEASTIAPAVQRLVDELRRRGLMNLPGNKSDLAADVVSNARSKWRGIGKIAPLLFIVVLFFGCRVTREQIVPATADDPAAIVIVWPDGSPVNPDYYVTEWSDMEERMVTVAPYRLVLDETSY